MATRPSKLRLQCAFRLLPMDRIRPYKEIIEVKIPQAAPETIAAVSMTYDQALFANVRRNRMIGLFLKSATYSLQNQLRITVKGVGQIAIDETHSGMDKRGRQYIVRVQAKGRNDQLSTVQPEQDLQCCAEKYPTLLPRVVSTQFIDHDLIAVFEFTVEDRPVRIVDERHHSLVR